MKTAPAVSLPDTVASKLKDAVQKHQSTVRSTVAASSVCYVAHVRNLGWQDPVCNGAVAGTIGQNAPIEAVAIQTAGTGGACINAHVQNLGWLGKVCILDGESRAVGTTGMALSLEAFDVDLGHTRYANTGGQAHVQNSGWLPAEYGDWVRLGTTGQNLALEAIRIWA
ncbi:hypothetical protein ACFQ6N_35525 [Kitasatospora sp. NPDC056446]|uniref:hypothetical protein n=1 Tax=Kitasatospora sp. NPDC056446 TaxID=3345819 RepID=UPI00369D3A5A